MEGKLIEDQKLYDQMKDVFQDAYVELLAIYEPDGYGFTGAWYCAAVDLFMPGLTFRVWFEMVDGAIRVRWADRWHFG